MNTEQESTVGHFFSSHKINEEVLFYPMYKHQKKFGISNELLEGQIKAVKFTEAKVSYDIYNNYWGELFKGISSEKVKREFEGIDMQKELEELNN